MMTSWGMVHGVEEGTGLLKQALTQVQQSNDSDFDSEESGSSNGSGSRILVHNKHMFFPFVIVLQHKGTTYKYVS